MRRRRRRMKPAAEPAMIARRWVGVSGVSSARCVERGEFD